VIVRQGRHLSSAEEIVNVLNIFLQEIIGKGMSVLHRLRHIDDDRSILIPKEIIFAEIAMDKIALMIHPSHVDHNGLIAELGLFIGQVHLKGTEWGEGEWEGGREVVRGRERKRYKERERERGHEREREVKRERETDRQTDKKERERQRETERETDRQTRRRERDR
jgi:hypothetical protein